jgi:hypothetical protein
MRQLSAAALTCGAFILIGDAAPAQATSNYDYKPDEYAIVDGGNAPNKQLSLAAHGTEDLGYGFHIYLMAEPAHKKIGALPGINDHTILDTAPDALPRRLGARLAPCRGAFSQRPSRHRRARAKRRSHR